jgi:hypothetical protein
MEIGEFRILDYLLITIYLLFLRVYTGFIRGVSAAYSMFECDHIIIRQQQKIEDAIANPRRHHVGTL